jgi:hypothetical protein
MVADILLNKALSLDELQEMVVQEREFEMMTRSGCPSYFSFLFNK